MTKNNQVKFKQKLLKIKSEKGSITALVLATMLFILIVLIIISMGINNKNSSQNADIKKIKAEYENQVNDIDKIYKETIERTL